ncbi:hypothetical protein JYU34_001389 [Plutella xylostella]|uniref:Reverse transcriptase domain-containing protein n=1 Tax=Plutella xylostella TaxID=51655 RepID=A0ABQ7R3U0_PLUXY|nr:hypothetical protein JYU34_001389 [Plutella xylostella]
MYTCKRDQTTKVIYKLRTPGQPQVIITISHFVAAVVSNKHLAAADKIMADQGETLPHPTGRGEVINDDTDSPSHVTQQFHAGQLQFYHHRWVNLGAPAYITKITSGYRIPFISKPPLQMPNMSNPKSPIQSSDEMDLIIEKMKHEGVLAKVNVSPSFLSSMFLVPKGDGSMRPIFNLKALNRYVYTAPFRLINVYKIPDFLQPSDWMANIDISQAYFHIPISEAHRRFLRLIYQRELLQMNCLPFGLSSAPKTFASVSNWMAQILRQRGIRLVVYLDDYLLANQDARVLKDHIKIAVNLLEYLGWKINYAKSVVQPCQTIEYLGITWDCKHNQKSLPAQKCAKLSAMITNLSTSKRATIKDLERVIGLMNFASFTVPRGRLNYRQLQRLLIASKRRSQDHIRMLLDEAVLQELQWWLIHLKDPSPVHHPYPTHYVVTDASDVAWGAQINNLSVTGTWSSQEKGLHCNLKELLAILKTLEDQCQNLRFGSLHLQCDNKTAVSYLRNEGGTKSQGLLEITYKIFMLLDSHQITLTVYHIPGAYNVEADHLSRFRKRPEWHLLPQATTQIFAKWGTPVIDLFASRLTRVVPRYCSLDCHDPLAEFHDAMTQQWNYELAWVFPPPFLMPKVLQHLNTCQGMYLIVAPRWEQVFWRPDLNLHRGPS